MEKGFKDFFEYYKDRICDYYNREVDEDDVDTIISFIYEAEPEELEKFNLIKTDYLKEGETVIEVNRDNFYLFQEDTDSIDETPARELAATIMEEFSYFQDLNADAYFEAEDTMTDVINKWFFFIEKDKK